MCTCVLSFATFFFNLSVCNLLSQPTNTAPLVAFLTFVIPNLEISILLLISFFVVSLEFPPSVSFGLIIIIASVLPFTAPLYVFFKFLSVAVDRIGLHLTLSSPFHLLMLLARASFIAATALLYYSFLFSYNISDHFLPHHYILSFFY